MSKRKGEEYKEMKQWASSQGWERLDLRRSGLRTYLAGNPGRSVYMHESEKGLYEY